MRITQPYVMSNLVISVVDVWIPNTPLTFKDGHLEHESYRIGHLWVAYFCMVQQTDLEYVLIHLIIRVRPYNSKRDHPEKTSTYQNA